MSFTKIIITLYWPCPYCGIQSQKLPADERPNNSTEHVHYMFSLSQIRITLSIRGDIVLYFDLDLMKSTFIYIN